MILSRVGEKFKTTEGYIIEIIEYKNARNCSVVFDDGLKLYNLMYGNIKRGTIKNPNHPSVLGVGYNGVGEYCSRIYGEKTKSYQSWIDMLDRCYNPKTHINQPSYKDCLVCDEWKNFQTFSIWFYKNTVVGYHLDKDILFKGNKIYSPETCCFVPSEINTLMIRSNKSRGLYPIGVTYNKRDEIFTAKMHSPEGRIYLGGFKTPLEAFEEYKKYKEFLIKQLAEKWKDKLTKPCYLSLINYKVEITD